MTRLIRGNHCVFDRETGAEARRLRHGGGVNLAVELKEVVVSDVGGLRKQVATIIRLDILTRSSSLR